MEKRIILTFMIIGGFLGGYAPALWGAAGFTFSSIIGNAVGALLGIWVGYKLTHQD